MSAATTRTEPLLLAALRCERVERRPLWIMRQAGRWLPEYRALRERHAFEELASTPALAAEVTLQPLRRFPLDAAIVFADLVSPLAALGLAFRFDPGPVLERPLRDAADIRALKVPVGPEIAPEVHATLRAVRADLPAGCALIGFGGAPWSLAAYAVQGGGKSDFPALRALLASDAVLFGELLDTLARLSAAYLVEQHRAGADLVQVFDSWAGLLSQQDWELHVRPHLTRLLDELRSAGVPTILFVNGAPHLAEAAGRLGAQGLAVCWRADLGALRAALGAEVALQGNLDPAVLLAGPQATARATRALLGRVPARGHIVNLGHGILPETPIESVAVLVETVHAEGAR
jgi:uroporphyrinogen decarboxylase